MILRPHRVVIAGCGFLGEAAAVLFSEGGSRVLGLCASEESAARIAGLGFSAAAMDISRPLEVAAEWREPDVLIHCASSGRGGVEAYAAVYREGLRHLLAGFCPKRVIFTGSTSVYAQVDGSRVDESSPAEPERETGRILLEAEAIALAHPEGFVARLAGIYGPGRSVLLRKFLEGSAVLEAGGERWINQIHRDDGAAALVHLASGVAVPGIYNVCDDTPARQRDVYAWIAACFQRPLPPEGPADLGRKRGWTSKRISNAKLRATGWMSRYPSYADALPGLITPRDATHRP